MEIHCKSKCPRIWCLRPRNIEPKFLRHFHSYTQTQTHISFASHPYTIFIYKTRSDITFRFCFARGKYNVFALHHHHHRWFTHTFTQRHTHPYANKQLLFCFSYFFRILSACFAIAFEGDKTLQICFYIAPNNRIYIEIFFSAYTRTCISRNVQCVRVASPGYTHLSICHIICVRCVGLFLAWNGK